MAGPQDDYPGAPASPPGADLVDRPNPRTEPAPDRRAHLSLIDVSVVICACAEERFEDLVGAVASIDAQTVRPLETIVVVDHNPALAMRTREQWPDILVADNLDQPGVSAARNVGVECASGAVVAFLDDDALAAPDWLESMLRVYREEAVMAVGGAIEPLWQVGQPPWFPDEFGWVVGCGYTGLPDRPMQVRNVIGTNMSFRREVFAGIGGFDSGIGQVGARSGRRCDETELCVRAGQRWPDRKIVHDPRVKVAHRVPAARSRLRYFVSRCYWEGRSKALISERVGQRAALSSELSYATRILPAGVVHGLRDALRGDRSGLGRAAAIVTGLTATSAGFLAARIAGPPARLLTRS